MRLTDDAALRLAGFASPTRKRVSFVGKEENRLHVYEHDEVRMYDTVRVRVGYLIILLAGLPGTLRYHVGKAG